jgi:hypothetical protein
MAEKAYVDVALTVDREGRVRPKKIGWHDPGGEIITYSIDRLKHVCRAASTRVGGCGIRYTVMINGRETYLFEEDGRWFVEAETC